MKTQNESLLRDEHLAMRSATVGKATFHSRDKPRDKPDPNQNVKMRDIKSNSTDVNSNSTDLNSNKEAWSEFKPSSKGARMAERSEVALKVQQNALMLREFTFVDIKRATRLKDSSVRTQLQRMREQGYLTSDYQEGSPRKKLYRLTKDTEKRLELLRRVGAFSSLVSTQEESVRPNSQAFDRLQQLIEQIYCSLLTPAYGQDLLEQATAILRYAWLAEGIDIDDAAEQSLWGDGEDDEDDEEEDSTASSIRAYLGFERLHLKYLSLRLMLMRQGMTLQKHASARNVNLQRDFEDIKELTVYFEQRDSLMVQQLQDLQIQFNSYLLQQNNDEQSLDLTPVMHTAQSMERALRQSGHEPGKWLIREMRQYLSHLSQPASELISHHMIWHSLRTSNAQDMGTWPPRTEQTFIDYSVGTTQNHVIATSDVVANEERSPWSCLSSIPGKSSPSGMTLLQDKGVWDTIDHVRKSELPKVNINA
jgi:DNA-binding PadR family transcriptional regulator